VQAGQTGEPDSRGQWALAWSFGAGLGVLPMSEDTTFKIVKVEYDLLTSPDEPEPSELYDGRPEAELARKLLGGVVVCRAIYETGWMRAR
jgi:hypothetical protein